MKQPCTRTETDTRAETVSYGVTDRLGRVIGTRFRAITVTYTGLTVEEADKLRAQDKYCQIFEREPGKTFNFMTQATRDGIGHQATHRAKGFATIIERDVALAKTLKAARKRAESPAARLKA